MYKTILSPQALQDISKLDKAVAQRIIDKLEWLAENFDVLTPIALTGTLIDYYKLRVGDWRVIYSLKTESGTININRIKHRSEAYKQ